MHPKFFEASGVRGSQASATLTVPAGYKIISGGAWMTGSNGNGNLLTASYPGSLRTWFARASDQVLGDPAVVNVGVLAINDPDDEYDVQIGSVPSDLFQHWPSATVTVPDGYVLTGGGACANYGAVSGQQFLTASIPTAEGTGWYAASHDHIASGPGSVTAYYIALRRRDGRAFDAKIVSATSAAPAGRPPRVVVKADDGYQLVGGGALVTQDLGLGNFLLASAPQLQPDEPPAGGPIAFQWFAESQDQQKADPEKITVRGIAIREHE